MEIWAKRIARKGRMSGEGVVDIGAAALAGALRAGLMDVTCILGQAAMLLAHVRYRLR